MNRNKFAVLTALMLALATLGCKKDDNTAAPTYAPDSVDVNYNPGYGFDASVYDMVLQPDGKIIAVGNFLDYNQTNTQYIARLNTDASYDSTFLPDTGSRGYIQTLALQSDGKVIIGGNFDTIQNKPHARFHRLTSGGVTDETFNPGGKGANYYVYALAIQNDDKILIGGAFDSINGVPRKSIARLNADGTLDASFNPGAGANFEVLKIVVKPNGQILAGGRFTSFNGFSYRGSVLLNADGSVDASYQPATGEYVKDIVLQPDGKILLAGWFASTLNQTPNYVARLHADGTVDTTFKTGTGPDAAVNALGLLPDGKVVIGGTFFKYDGSTFLRFGRLSATGKAETTYAGGAGFNAPIRKILVQADGNIVAAGDFTTFDNIVLYRIVRLKK